MRQASPPAKAPREPDNASQAASFLRSRCSLEPEIGLILGSGLGGLADHLEGPTSVRYSDIPGFPCSQVEGHANRLVFGRLAGKVVVAMQGRVHFYEGYSPQQTAFPVRVLGALGVKILLASNAAGGLNPDFRGGDLMLIADHIFLPGLAGHNPLRGPSEPPRFPNMSDAYDAGLRKLARQQEPALREGVYVMVSGPSYETPAECRFLRTIGADAVGMSTCPEVVAARHLGLRVIGISLITNILTGAPTSHEEVLATADEAAGRFCRLVEGIVGAL